MNSEREEITYQKIHVTRSQTAARTELDLEDTALPKSANQFQINSREGRNPSNQGFWKESNLWKKEKLHQDPNPHFDKSKLAETLPEPFKDSIEVGKEDSPFTFSDSSQFSPFLFSKFGEPLPFLTVAGTSVGLELENPLLGLEQCGSGQTENEGLKPSLRKRKKWARQTRPSSDIVQNNHPRSKRRIDEGSNLQITLVAKKAKIAIKLPNESSYSQLFQQTAEATKQPYRLS
ncbi:hypothetical protein U1Q18_045882 [Sarracenia purpurea var. burkii]